MTVWQIIDSILFKPLQILFEVIYMFANNIIENPGLSIIVLSLVMNFLVLPLYRRADAMQEEERDMEARLHAGVSHIKKTFKGDEKMMILQTYYRQNNYKPTYVLKGAISLFLEIPFFIAAYRFLSQLELLKGVSFGPISDLGSPDALLTIGALTINVLPIIMTAVNLVSCVIFTKGAAPKTKIQLYAMAVFFLFFLYTSPSGLVFYWTLNNIFSLVKTIFYKLKNPKRVLCILSFVVGIAGVVSALVFPILPKQKAFLLAIGIILLLPLPIYLISSRIKKEKEEVNIPEPDKKIFIAGCLFMSILAGFTISLALLKSSPQEFVNVTHFDNPIWFAVSCFCISLGTFTVWFNIFYWLASPKAKNIFNIAIWVIAVASTVNYFFFGKSLGLLNSSLIFENGVNYTAKEMLINFLVLLGSCAVVIILFILIKKHIFKVLPVFVLALAVMVPFDVVAINSSIEQIEASAEASLKEPVLPLSKNGKNVIVLMLDRAVGDFVPYIFNEKPELLNKFSGFTAYTNTVAFNGATNMAAPALYGGYEYTPENVNKRPNESLVDKHNESLKVMPTLFDQNDFTVTVCDPPYANYQWVPDLSIYNDNPRINKFITMGKFADSSSYYSWKNSNMRNFFCYSILKCAPVALQNTLYNNGNYFSSTAAITSSDEMTYQERENTHKGHGIFTQFTDSYDVLKNLNTLVDIRDDETNTFLMIDNDTTHEPMLLQEPEYIPVENVDNTEYDAAHTDRFTLNGRTINMETEMQVIHYHANMAAYIQLGNFFDWMREEGVYDNTRIIIVSDHGQQLFLNDDVELQTLATTDMLHPILLVKDYNSSASQLQFSEEFMTTADVPSLATNGLIDNAKNPYTGNLLYNPDAKTNPVYIFESYNYDVTLNNGNQFTSANWYKLINQNMHDANNWILNSVDTLFPDYTK